MEQSLRDLIVRILEKKGLEFSWDMPLKDYLDSLDYVEVIMDIEDEFMVRITDETADNFRTPTDIRRHLEFLNSKK